MKNKKLFVLVALFVITLAVASVTVGAVLSNEPAEEAEEQIETTPSYYKIPTVEYVSPEDFDTKLTYISTDSNGIKTYKDNSGSRVLYLFESDNSFMGIMAPSVVSEYRDAISLGLAERISKEDAEKIAIKTARSLFGDAMDQFGSIELMEDDGRIYRFRFGKDYGKDGFVSGYACNVSIYEDGYVGNCCIQAGRSNYIGFNEALLDGIEKSDVQEYITSDVKSVFGSYTEIEMESMDLMKIKGKYYIRTSVNGYAPNPAINTDGRIINVSTVDETKGTYSFVLVTFFPLEEGCEPVTADDFYSSIRK